jgi:hypothetical protein
MKTIGIFIGILIMHLAGHMIFPKKIMGDQYCSIDIKNDHQLGLLNPLPTG